MNPKLLANEMSDVADAEGVSILGPLKFEARNPKFETMKKSKNPKMPFCVIPAKAGIQPLQAFLDSRSCPPQADSRE